MPLTDQLYLLVGTFVSSLISGTVGMGGGSLLLVVMSMILPVHLLIPIHGIVQVGSNASRVILHYRSIDQKIFIRYFWGAVVGVLIGTFLPVQLQFPGATALIGFFIIAATWLKLSPDSKFKRLFNYYVIGILSTVSSLFVGIAGPLMHPFILGEKHLDRYGFIGTESACAVTTHLLKVFLFVWLGVSLAEYAGLIVCMVLTTFLGSMLGKRIMQYCKDDIYKLFVKCLITVLACRMVWVGLQPV